MNPSVDPRTVDNNRNEPCGSQTTSKRVTLGSLPNRDPFLALKQVAEAAAAAGGVGVWGPFLFDLSKMERETATESMA